MMDDGGQGFQADISLSYIGMPYGYYVLPILFGDRLVGRIEMVYDRKRTQLNVSHIWYEPGVRVTKKLESGIESALKCFEVFCRS